MAKERIQLNLRLPMSLHPRLKTLAEQERRSLNEQIVHMLETHPALNVMEVNSVAKYKGWRIRTGFLGGDLFGDMLGEERTVDKRESVRRYAQMVQDALEQEFPGADIEVNYEMEGTGATPATLETLVTDPEHRDYRPGDYFRSEGVRIAERVDEIAGEIWESWEWVVYEDEDE